MFRFKNSAPSSSFQPESNVPNGKFQFTPLLSSFVTSQSRLASYDEHLLPFEIMDNKLFQLVAALLVSGLVWASSPTNHYCLSDASSLQYTLAWRNRCLLSGWVCMCTKKSDTEHNLSRHTTTTKRIGKGWWTFSRNFSRLSPLSLHV